MANGYQSQEDGAEEVSELDDRLMVAIGLGDQDAMNALARRHRARVLRFALRMLGDRAAAEDVAQETLIKLWQAAPTYEPLGRFMAFLYAVARSRCAEHAGRLVRDGPLLASDLAPVGDACGPEHVGRALDGMPRDYRDVLVLSVCEGLTYGEIADALGIPKGTVASRKAAALRMLRDRVESLRGAEGEVW